MGLKPIKVLICDDSVLIRKKLRDSLLSCGCGEILEAEDGQRAVEVYRNHRPDLVFMDIVMPVKSGIDAVAEIKAFDGDAKVVMASTVGTKANLKKALEAGAYEFIQKPWEDARIMNIVQNFRKGGV